MSIINCDMMSCMLCRIAENSDHYKWHDVGRRNWRRTSFTCQSILSRSATSRYLHRV